MQFNEYLDSSEKENINLSNFQKDLNDLETQIFLKQEKEKNEILSKKISNKEEFKKFLKIKTLNNFDRKKPFGRYLRVLRYENKFK